MIVALNNFNPAYKQRQLLAKMEGKLDPAILSPLPKIQRWSDVAFLQWDSCVPDDQRDQMRSVLRSNFHNVETLAIMSHILGEDASSLMTPRHGCYRKRPRWPGVVLDMKKEKAQALLGTPNGSGVDWLLVERKRELGSKIIDKVFMFFSEYEHDDGVIEEQPNLLFAFKDKRLQMEASDEPSDDDSDEEADEAADEAAK